MIGAARFLEEFFEYEVVKAEVNEDGIINIEQLNKIVDKNTLLVSIMAVNSEIGTYQPLEEIAKICREHNVIFHVDAAQALYFDIDVVQQGIDLLSLSSHKMYGPKGIGALYVNQLLHIRPTPLFHGGNQQNSYRSGTIPTELTAGFAAAIQELTSGRKNEIIHLKSLRNHAWNILKELFPDIKVNGNWNKRHPGNINVTFPGVDAKSLIGSLQPSIAISTGSACSSGIPEPSHVLKAIGLSTEDAESTIRISLGRSTNKTEIEKAMGQSAKEAYAYKKEFCRDHIEASSHE